MKIRFILLIILVVLTLAGVIAWRLTAVRAAWPAARTGSPVPARPKPDDPPFAAQPFAPTFEARRATYLQWAAGKPTSAELGGIFTDILKLAYDPAATLSEPALKDALDFVNGRNDTADFTVAGLVRLLYLYGDRLTASQRGGIESALVNFKYWLDEPSPTPMELWTENHQILAHSAEYLAGQRFPDTTFSNDGKTGREHMALARGRILRWIDWRSRTGMAEWDAVIYYRMDIAALLNLADFAQDEEVARRAAMMVDLLLMDMAADSFHGQYVSSHGRATADSIKSAAGQSIGTLQALAWGLGRFGSTSEMATVALATSTRYRVPPVIEAVAQDVPAEVTNFERHSIPVTDEAAARYGLRFDAIEDVPIWWGMEAFTHPKTVGLTVRTADTWGLWHYADFRDLEAIGKPMAKLGLLSAATRLFDPDANGTLMSEVNKITFRTPDYALASSQDYRKGEKGYQQSIWRAALSPYAVVFVTNPDSQREDDRHRPSYWSSDGRLPRTGQVRNILVALYDLPDHAGLPPFEARHFLFTHAYFPRWAFDEVVEQPVAGGGGWIFGRKGDGYIALYSAQPYLWQTEGPDAGQEVIALGGRAVWLIQMGRRAVDGSFEQFVKSVTSASLTVHGLAVEYRAPGLGQVTFDWSGPLRLDGKEIALRDYPRFNNPYTRAAAFGTGQYTFEFAGKRLTLDFPAAVRRVE